MQYNQTLESMVGRLIMSRVGLDRSLAKAFLNERMRSVLDMRPVWSGLLRKDVISIPTAYTIGTINVTTGSTSVVGTATAWPVSDVVSTVVVDAILTPRQIWVTLGSLTGVTLDTVLYIDSAGPQPEWCPVLDMAQGRVLLNFQYPHAAGSTATASSLNGLQMRVAGYTSPIFTIISVTSPTTLILDNHWGAASITSSSYWIVLIYTTIDPNLKGILLATDPFQQIELRVHVSQDEVNLYDPNRTATNSPTSIVDAFPNVNGNQQYEIYPPQVTAYQLNVLYHVQWPDMRLPGDFPPPFLNPNCLLYGALADAFRTPCPRPPDGKDLGYNPRSAADYESLFNKAVIDAVNADESKYMQMFTWSYAQMFGSISMGSFWEQSHDLDSALGNY